MKDFSRLIALIGEVNYQKLKNSKIAIVGLGGVGGYVVEGLARSGVENFTLVDDDIVKSSNMNRQIIALQSNLGKYKAELWGERIKDINSDANVKVIAERYSEDNPIDFTDVDYVVDAIDSIGCKIELITECYNNNIPIISCMGTGAKLGGDFVVSDLYSTSYDAIARRLRRELKKRGVEKLKVVCSEESNKSLCVDEDGKYVPSSIVYSPCMAGMLIVKEIIKDITLK